MISCLMVTQQSRKQLLRESVRCFVSQTLADKELQIVHDGDHDFDSYLVQLARSFPNERIHVTRSADGKTLGELRNISIAAASFPLVCQWDDDDLYHPRRLELQLEMLNKNRDDFCFLTDQLHLFSEQQFVFWDDWSIESYPGSLIQGTLLGKKDKIGEYPKLKRGEDTGLVLRLVAEGKKITAVSGFAWLYLYIYHGQNAWDMDHHKAISNLKRLDHRDLTNKLDTLCRELPAYQLNFDSLIFPHNKGAFKINPKNGELLS